jgi:hypothetical protein
MNTLLPAPIVRDEKRWYFLSLFYAKESWDMLISHITDFYNERKNIFSHCLFSFSEERGEHLQVVFAASVVDTNDYTFEIQTCFQTFFNQHPSISRTQFPYGEAIWCNYPNNSLTWKIFKLPDYSEQYIDFHQQTMKVALKLTEGDFSGDSLFSLGMYLIIKGLSCVDDKEHKNALSRALHEAKSGSAYFIHTAKELLKEIDMDEIGKVIESYKNENTTEYPPELITWLNEVKFFLKRYDFQTICSYICKIIGLSGFRQLVILELLNSWYNRPCEE